MNNLIEIVSHLSAMIGQMEESAKVQYNLNNLTHSQMHYLETISRFGNPNITELSVTLRLSKPTVKVSIDKLIEKDFVFKIQSDADRRTAHLHLTEKGKLINQMHDYAHKRIAETINRKLDKTELAQLVNLLSKVLSEEK